jgi:predicted transposase/invertase (TIGR01784 family)
VNQVNGSSEFTVHLIHLSPFIDMVKFRRFKEKDIINNTLHRWLTFFDKRTSNDILEEIIKMDTAIQKAQEQIAFVKSSDEEFRAYQMREMAMCDYTSGINFARREGIVKLFHLPDLLKPKLINYRISLIHVKSY